VPSNALNCAVRAPHASKINLKPAAVHVDMNGPTILDARTARQQCRAQQGSVFFNCKWVRRHNSTTALMCCTGSHRYSHCFHRLEFEFAQNRTPLCLRAQFATKVVCVVCVCSNSKHDVGAGSWCGARVLEFEFAQNRTPLCLRAQFATKVVCVVCVCSNSKHDVGAASWCGVCVLEFQARCRSSVMGVVCACARI